MQDQRGDVDGPEHVAHVLLVGHPLIGDGGAGAHAVAGQLGLPGDHLGIERAEPVAHHLLGAPQPVDLVDPLLVLLAGDAPGIVRSPRLASAGAMDDQRDRAGGVRSREQARERAGFGGAVDDRPLGADLVHHRAGIVHARLHVRRPVHRHRIRHAAATAVEDDQPRERGEPAQEPLVSRLLPDDLDMGVPRLQVDEIDRAVAQHFVCQPRAVLCPRVPRFRKIHHRSHSSRGPYTGAASWIWLPTPLVSASDVGHAPWRPALIASSSSRAQTCQTSRNAACLRDSSAHMSICIRRSTNSVWRWTAWSSGSRRCWA